MTFETVLDCKQGCQMVYFQTKNPNMGKFRRALEWKKVSIFFGYLVVWYILWPFGNLVAIFGNFSPFGYIVSRKIWQP
jgi:hypothetical protein